MKTIFQVLITILFILALSQIAKAQINGYVYLVSDSARLVTGNQIIVSREYQNIVLEPIPGKATRWTITRVEEVPIVVDPVTTIVNNTELIYVGFWEHPSGTWGTISHSSTIGATARYTFNGNRIEVYSAKDKHHGLLGYTINGGLEKSVNLNSTVREDGVKVIDELLPLGEHTITLRVIDKTVLIDYLKISK